MDTYQDDDGQNWISCDMLCVGDCGGAGSIGEANIRSVKKHLKGEDWWVRHGAYHSKQLWLLDNEDNRELVEGLEEDYPCFDDEMVSEVEAEWEVEAWESWLKSDLLRTLPDELGEVIEDEESIDLFQVYREAMEATNTYPVAEEAGVCVRIDDIKEKFAELILERLARLA